MVDSVVSKERKWIHREMIAALSVFEIYFVDLM